MFTIDAGASALLLIDFQVKLMRVMDEGADAIANASRLLDAANILGVPALFTEQNTKGLGPTVPELAPDPSLVVHKMTFDACGQPGFLQRLGDGRALILAGCEAHVCVLQTALGLIGNGRRVFVVRDAIASRRPESKETAVRRMERHGADIVTVEMVVFEWLKTAENPAFRETAALIK